MKITIKTNNNYNNNNYNTNNNNNGPNNNNNNSSCNNINASASTRNYGQFLLVFLILICFGVYYTKYVQIYCTLFFLLGVPFRFTFL